jgi:hypothetical protein
LCDRFAITSQSLRIAVRLAALSLRNHCAISEESLRDL